MDSTSNENGVTSPTNRIRSSAVTTPKPATSPRLRSASSTTANGSAENGMTSPGARPALLRRHSSSRRHSQDGRRKGRRRRKKLPSPVAVLEREKERLEAEAKRNSVSLVRITSKNVVYFVLVYSTVLCLRAAVAAYLDGVLDELRKKYAFSATQLALIQGTQMIGLLASLFFVALLGRNWHKPLLLTVGVLVSSLGTIVCAVPYFVEKTTGTERSSCAGYGAIVNGLPLTSYAQGCQYGQWNWSYTNPCEPCLTNQSFIDERQKNLSIICIAGFLIGLGTGMFVTTGYIYIEESGNRKNGPIFYGVFLSMTGFGHFLGSCSTWWFLGYSEDLQGDGEEMRPSWTVKAWWLGFVFYSILLFICSFFFLFFPKWITEPDWLVTARRRHLRHLARQIDHERALRKLKREKRKQKQRRRSRLGSVPLSSTSESLDDCALEDPVSPVSGATLSTSGPVDCLTPATETSIVFVGSGDGTTQEASSSSSSDSETDGPEMTVISPRRTSGGTGSSLWIIAEEEDSGLSRLPSSALPVGVDSERRSGNGDETTPVWPLHLPAEANRQSRVVTFASGVPDAAGNKRSNLRGYGGVGRKQSTVRTQRKQVSKKVGKTLTALKRTLLLPVFTLSLIGTVLSAYLSAGYRSNVARFVEVQYGQEPIYAWFYTAGLCYSIAETLGPLVGGIIVHKLRLSLFKQIEMIICLLIINLVLFVLIFPINLPGGGFQWWQNGNSSSPMSSVPPLASTCLTKCDCLDVQLDPVCSPAGSIKYYSACHAGCTQLYLQNDSIIYSNCSCADGALASSSFCLSDFPIYGAFWVVLFLAITAHSMGQVSVILIFLRSVLDVDRHLALSIAIWIIVVAAFIPGPPVFDALEMTSCTASRLNCFNEEVCWMHDLDHYRYVIHGASMAFQLVAICFFAGALYPLRINPIEPVGYGKDEVRSGIRADQDELEIRGPETGNQVARPSQMEKLQSRIALNLLANQQDLMKFSQPERKSVETELATDPAPSLSSGTSNLKAELEAQGREEARRRASSSDSSVFAKTAKSDDDDDTEVTSRRTIFSNQSDDTVFGRNDSAGQNGYDNRAYDAEEEEERGTGGQRATTVEGSNDISDREITRTVHRPDDNDDLSSTITHSTRL